MDATYIRKMTQRREPGITLRLNKNLRKRIKRIAREDRRSLAGVIEIAVIKFLEERTA